MGQYYKPVVLLKTKDKPKAFFEAWDYNNGEKLMEHSYVGNSLMNAVENAFAPDGDFYKYRLVWAGDYADDEKDIERCLFMIAEDNVKHKIKNGNTNENNKLRYYVNHSKKQYVDKENLTPCKDGWVINPLSLLTCEGNGRGGGDYEGTEIEKVGIWARDIISMETDIEPLKEKGYEELNVSFVEDY